MALIIHAPNVHRGGGATLLKALLRAATERNGDIIVLLDERLPLDADWAAQVKIFTASPSVVGRLRAEWNLRRLAHKGDTILAFGNLPPLFRPRARCVLFIQNRYLLDNASAKQFPWRVRIRIGIERFWLKATVRHIDTVVVQTPTMSKLARSVLRVDPQVLPFIDKFRFSRLNMNAMRSDGKKRYDFVYVSSGEPHKNHDRLVEAWGLLSEESIFPLLCLTLSESRAPQIVRLIERARDKGAQIENIGDVSLERVADLYAESSALIYPSTMESFGLPLLEATEAGIPIIASERDFVRDVAEPAETFDPMSAISIARAVKRFVGRVNRKVDVLNAEEFLGRVWLENESAMREKGGADS